MPTAAQPPENGEKHQGGPGARLWLSNAALAGLVAAAVSIFGAPKPPPAPVVDEQAMIDRVSLRVLEKLADGGPVVREQLKFIAEKIEAIDRRTADLPRIAAEVTLMQRSLAK